MGDETMSLEKTTFQFPAEVCYGPGTISELPDALGRTGVSRPLVTDASLIATEAFSRFEIALGKAACGKS